MEPKDCQLNQVTVTSNNPIEQFRFDTILSKEPETIEWIKNMNESSVMLDIGSNIGIYTLASLIRNISRVYAFEPSPLNFSRLSSFIYENGLQAKSNLFCLGISNKQSIVYFSHDLELESGLAEFRQCTSHSEDSFPVYLTPLDSLQDIFGIDTVTHLKVDVDGPELSVLNGCHHLLSSNALSSVLVECSINKKLTIKFVSS